MTTRRSILRQAVDGWRTEGLIDEATWRKIAKRLDETPPTAELDDRLAPAAARTADARAYAEAGEGAAQAAGAREIAGGRSFATDAMQLVGGLLVGAALVALVVYLDPVEDQRALLMLALGTALAVAGFLGERAGLARGLAEGAIAGGFVPLVVAAALSFADTPVLVPALVSLLAFGLLLAPRAAGPSVVAAGIAYSLATAAATLEGSVGNESPALARSLWMATLLAFGAALLVRRRTLWHEIGLALFVTPLVIAFLELLELAGGGSTEAAEIAVGIYLGVFLAVGLLLGSRGLVTGAGVGLTIDAVALAFDLGGPLLAVLILAGLGGLLLWQAELLRRYYGRRSQGSPDP